MFSKNLKYLLRKKNLSQRELSRKLGLNPTTVQKWAVSSRTPKDMNMLNRLAIELGASVDDMLNVDMEEQETANRKGGQYVRIKVYSPVPAGIPSELIGEVVGEEDIPKKWERGGREYFGFIVRGDSMNPKYIDGDIVICRKSETCKNNDDCVVLIDGEVTFKRVVFQNGIIVLQPINTAFEPIIVSDTSTLQIQGVAVELRRSL